MKKKILKTMYTVGGFKPFHYLNRNEALILTYHRFSKESDSRRISRNEFEQHLLYLKKHTNLLPLNDLVGHLKEQNELPANSTAITIDDGYLDAYEIAFPLLKQHSVPATVYAITEFVSGNIWLWTDQIRYVLEKTKSGHLETEFEDDLISIDIGGETERASLAERINANLKKLDDDAKSARINKLALDLDVELPQTPPTEYCALNWDQAREMESAGVNIECHTVNHPMLTKIDAARLKFELTDSRSKLEKEIGRPSLHFCYPNGDLNEEVRNAVKDAGFESAVTTGYGFCDAGTDLLRLRRIDGQPAISSFAQSVSGFEKMRERIGI